MRLKMSIYMQEVKKEKNNWNAKNRELKSPFLKTTPLFETFFSA